MPSPYNLFEVQNQRTYIHTTGSEKRTHLECSIMAGICNYLQMLDVGCKHRVGNDTEDYAARPAPAILFRGNSVKAVLYLPRPKAKADS